MLKSSLLAGLTLLVLSSAACATCLPESVINDQARELNPYVHEVAGKGGTNVSLHQRLEGADTEKQQILEVIRKEECIISISVLSTQELADRYEIYGAWSELEEAAFGEGAGEGEGEEAGEGGDRYADEDTQSTFDSFGAYPVSKIYRGPVRQPDFKRHGRKFATFRTRILDGLKGGPNFAGDFAVIQFGCGSGCSNVLIASARTGQVFQFPRGGESHQALEVRYKLNSKLMVANWCKDAAWSECVEEAFVFENGNWTKTATVSAASK